jgi:hypothetical protein
MKIHTMLTIAWLSTLVIGCKPAPETASAPVNSTAFAPLTGRWVRPDGGYILRVQRVESNGQASVEYFNPNPIHISQAQASIEGATLKLFVELQDEGYPGCTYKLSYDKAKDQLAGVYFQAAMQQSYDIVFERAP